MKAKVEFLWYKIGDEIKDELEANISLWKAKGLIEDGEVVPPIDGDGDFDKVEGELEGELEGEVVPIISEPVKVEGDLDGDGDFDKDDLKIAAKTLAKGRKRKANK